MGIGIGPFLCSWDWILKELIYLVVVLVLYCILIQCLPFCCSYCASVFTPKHKISAHVTNAAMMLQNDMDDLINIDEGIFEDSSLLAIPLSDVECK